MFYEKTTGSVSFGRLIVAEPGEDWAIVDWNKDIEVWAGVQANIGRHLKARGVNPDIIF